MEENKSNTVLSLHEIIDFTRYFCGKHKTKFSMDKVLDLWNDEREKLIDNTVSAMMEDYADKAKSMKDISLVEAMKTIRMVKSVEYEEDTTIIEVQVFIDTRQGRANKLDYTEKLEIDEVLDKEDADDAAEDLAFQIAGKLFMDWVSIITKDNKR